jgi:uncharacterized protein YjbI with pentapeptide repeats
LLSLGCKVPRSTAHSWGAAISPTLSCRASISITPQLWGSQLVGARLQGASLNGTQLQGVFLFHVQLQGASLSGTQLQGANLYEGQLQGAFLFRVQLQGASLLDAQLAGAALLDNYVWRTDPPSNTEGAFVIKPEPGPKYSGLTCTTSECDWSEESYGTAISLIEELDLLVRDRALQQIAVLGKPPFVAHEASAKAWTDLANQSAHSSGSYFNTLAKELEEIGCAADGAPYVIGGLTRRISANQVQLDFRFSGYLSQEAEVAAAFLDEAKCPGARGLSEENKAKLQEIHNRGLPTSPKPGAAAR